MDTDSESDFSDRPPVDIFVETCELSDQDATVTDPDQTLSEEQNYRMTMRGFRLYMGCMHVNDWLCIKMKKLNLTLEDGYPSYTSEAGGLLKNQFVPPGKSQSR